MGNAAPPQHQVQRNEMKYTWEHSLLLPAHPEEIRKEVDILLSDLIVRLKQLLFNSILCAYYVGFIPMQFADVSELHGPVSSLSWCAFVFLCRGVCHRVHGHVEKIVPKSQTQTHLQRGKEEGGGGSAASLHHVLAVTMDSAKAKPLKVGFSKLEVC